MGQRAWQTFSALSLLAIAGLSLYTLFTIQRVGESVQTTLTELRRLQVSELSSTWTSNGKSYTHKSVQQEGEGYDEFLGRFDNELQAAQQKYPPD